MNIGARKQGRWPWQRSHTGVALGSDVEVLESQPHLGVRSELMLLEYTCPSSAFELLPGRLLPQPQRREATHAQASVIELEGSHIQSKVDAVS